MLHLCEDDVRRLLHPLQLVDALEAAFARDYRATARMPTRTQLPLANGTFLLMPCSDYFIPALGFKSVFVHHSPPPGVERVQASYFLLDPASGELLATFEANHLTDLRTAATSAVATRLMARKGASVLGIFGTGRQARAHLELFARVLGFKKAFVSGSTPQRTRDFCERMSSALHIKVEAADPRACAAEADVLCTCTSATQPLFDGRWLKPGAHLNLVGAFRPSDREVDAETVRRARIAVDTYDGALAEAGDLIIPINEGAIDRKHIKADLHELASGKCAGRASEGEITLFKSVGCALEDLVAANLLCNAAPQHAAKSVSVIS